MAAVLVLCTANMARSPLLAARLRVDAAAHPLGGDLSVASGGVDARFGDAASDHAQQVSAGWGANLATHSSVPLSGLSVDGHDLVITMEIGHSRAVVRRSPHLAPRVFTMPELVEIAERRIPPEDRQSLPDAAVSGTDARVRAAVALADAHRPHRLRRRRHDVADPIRAGAAEFEALGHRFEEASAAILGLLLGPSST